MRETASVEIRKTDWLAIDRGDLDPGIVDARNVHRVIPDVS